MSGVVELIAEVARRHGGAPAVAEPDGGPGLTYAALAERSARVAGGLAELGLGRGDVLALLLPNRAEYLILLLAAARIGACAVGVNTRYRAEELAGVLRTASARAIVLAPQFLGVDFAAMLAGVRAELPALRSVVVLGAPAAALAGAVPYEALERGPALAHAAGAHANELAAAFTTSGTTSAPKLAAHDGAGVARHARNDAAAFGLRPGDVNLCALPFCGVFGFNVALATLAGGATVLPLPVFDGAAAARAIERHGVTHLFGSDAMLAAIPLAPGALRSLRGGGFADFGGRLREQLERWEGAAGVRFTGLYGSSECFALTAAWPVELDAAQRARVGGVLVDPAIGVRAADPQSGAPCPPGTPGELQFRGYNVAQAYVGNPAASAAARTADGWFRSGDLGYTCDATSFVFLARLGDSLRLRGFLVDPREIEEFLERHPAVAKAQVVGADGEAGQVPVAFVQPRAGAALEPDALIAFARERIAGYKVPHAVIAVDGFPTTPSPNGEKVRKAELRERARAVLAARAGH